MRYALFTVAAAAVGYAAWLAVGCSPSGLGGAGEVTVRVCNGGLDDVRVGVDRTGTGTVSQITPAIPPSGSARLTLTLTTGRTFDAFARGAETGNEFAGPFPCTVDLFCGDPNETQLIWTGAEVLCTATDVAIVELVNESSETAFLLADDEQPQLPILPLLPGERRFVARPAGAGQSSVLVRAFVDDPLRGLQLMDFVTCRVGVGCRPVRVRYADGGLLCGE